MLKTDRRQIYNYLDYHCIKHRIVSQTALCWCPRKIPIVFESIAGWKTITLRSSLRYLRLSHIESCWVILIDRDLADGIWSLELGAREERLSLLLTDKIMTIGIWERQNGRKWTVEWICHHGKVVSRDIPQLMEQKYYEYTLRNLKWRWRDWLWQNALSVMVLRAKRVAHCLFTSFCVSSFVAWMLRRRAENCHSSRYSNSVYLAITCVDISGVGKR